MSATSPRLLPSLQPASPASPPTALDDELSYWRQQAHAPTATETTWCAWLHLCKTQVPDSTALAEARLATARLPMSGRVLSLAGILAQQANQPALGAKWLRRSLKLRPQHSQTRFALALCHEAQRDFQAAITQYVQLLQQDPGWLPAYHNLGTLYIQLGQTSNAVALFRQLCKRFPHYHQGRLGLAMALDVDGQRQHAIKAYRQFIALCPTSPHTPDVVCRLQELGATTYWLGKRAGKPLATKPVALAQ